MFLANTSLPDDDQAAMAALSATLTQSPSDAMAGLEAMVAQARAAGRTEVLGHGLCHLARCMGLAGQHGSGEAVAAEALELFVNMQHPGGQAMALNAKAMILIMRGDHAGALDHLKRALPLARQAEDGRRLSSSLSLLGNVLQEMGHLPAAAAAFEESLSLFPADADVRSISGLRSNLSMALATWAEQDRDAGVPADDWLPRAERAVALAEGCMADCEADEPMRFAAASDTLAQALLAKGDAQRAWGLLSDSALQTAVESSPFNAVYIAHSQARVLLALGRADDAVARCEAALATGRSIGSDVRADAVYETLCQAHEERGDFRAALQAHRQFHALRTKMVFERAEQSARAVVSQLDLERAKRESRIDPLTGLLNRRAFDERLTTLLGLDAGELTLMLLDIDHFKSVNDQHGHPAGDQLLQRVAGVLIAQCRGSEPPVRLGGDEFAVLVESPMPKAVALAERIRQAVALTGDDPDGPVPTLSIGLAQAQASDTVAELMARADRALYAVKHAGRDGISTSG
jgi:diguanylate cyclase (GGDEF)-like protein